MEIEVWSAGKTKFTADTEYQEPMIREAIDQRGDVASVILGYTDSDRNGITYDEYARVTGDLPGLVLFEGWLTGDRDAPPPASALTAGEQAAVVAAHHASEAGLPPEAAAIVAQAVPELAAELDGLRKALRAITLGIAEPSPKTVAGNALNGRYFDPETDAGVWSMADAAEPAPRSATATETSLRLALAFIEQVRDGAYGDLATVDAEQALYEIGMP
jgi:hypothetical protein